MNFTQTLLTKEKSNFRYLNFRYLHVRMNDHLARYRQIKQTQLSQLNILNKFHDLLNTKNIAIKQVKIKRHLYLLIYDITKSDAKIFKNSNGKYYIHREMIFCKKDSYAGTLTDLLYSDAKLITSAGGNITDSYNNGFWTIQFDNFVDINTGKNLLK